MKFRDVAMVKKRRQAKKLSLSDSMKKLILETFGECAGLPAHRKRELCILIQKSKKLEKMYSNSKATKNYIRKQRDKAYFKVQKFLKTHVTMDAQHIALHHSTSSNSSSTGECSKM